MLALANLKLASVSEVVKTEVGNNCRKQIQIIFSFDIFIFHDCFQTRYVVPINRARALYVDNLYATSKYELAVKISAEGVCFWQVGKAKSQVQVECKRIGSGALQPSDGGLLCVIACCEVLFVLMADLLLNAAVSGFYSVSLCATYSY